MALLMMIWLVDYYLNTFMRYVILIYLSPRILYAISVRVCHSQKKKKSVSIMRTRKWVSCFCICNSATTHLLDCFHQALRDCLGCDLCICVGLDSYIVFQVCNPFPGWTTLQYFTFTFLCNPYHHGVVCFTFLIGWLIGFASRSINVM